MNPSLRVLRREGSAPAAARGETGAPSGPGGGELLLIWKEAEDAEPRVRSAEAIDLLALKLIAEQLDPLDVARDEGCSVRLLEGALHRARVEGLVLFPLSRLCRPPGFPAALSPGDEAYLRAGSFTLQWHITQACDLRCKHCYDRSDRPVIPFAEALRVLDDLYRFCRDRNVPGHVTFSGGNPLLHQRFLDLHRAAHERGFTVAILGNPASPGQIEEVLAAGPVDFFQVSLEGTSDHNDEMRGPGHFERALRFLRCLRERDVYSMVMLTLTRDNMGQVLLLGEELRGVADIFHFNRLSPVGEGAALALPSPADYLAFLESYAEVAGENPVLGFKENLLNRTLAARGAEPFGGCTGYGCGAAFNFVSLLPDGEVHACRKFSSRIGNVLDQSLAEIYESDSARRYRAGATGCSECGLRPVCGGCMASAAGMGLDPLRDRDPFCPGVLPPVPA